MLVSACVGGCRPKRSPNASVFALQWNIGFRLIHVHISRKFLGGLVRNTWFHWILLITLSNNIRFHIFSGLQRKKGL